MIAANVTISQRIVQALQMASRMQSLQRLSYLQVPMRALLGALGSPQADLPVAHVAGTKGKGSVVAMLQCILREAGYKVGTYTRYSAPAFRGRSLLCIWRSCTAKLCRPFLRPATPT